MPKNTEKTVLIKPAHFKQNFTTQQLVEFARCADPVTGPYYFMENYFYIQPPIGGGIRYQPYDYQKRLLKTYHEYRNSIALMPRQTGKSTTAAGYLLWYAMFVEDSTVVIAAHKYQGAQEIMQRIRYAYEHCPDFIRAGAVDYNKGSITFDNGSRIVSQTTTENTGRGMSISLLYCLDGESTVKIRNKKTLVEEDITLRELYSRICEIVPTENFMFAENTDYEILTPDGWKDFRGITQTDEKITFQLTLSDGNTVTATAGHHFFIDNQKVKLGDLQIDDFIDTVEGLRRITSIVEQPSTTVYDIVEVDQKDHKFIVNDHFVTKNCDELAFVRPSIAQEFWTSITPTLSTGGKCMITSTPNSDEDQFAQIWRAANKCIDEYGNTTDLGVNGFKAFKSSWREHPDRDEKYGEEMKAKLGEERFRREIECCNGNTTIDIDRLGELTISEFFDSILDSTMEQVTYKENKKGYKVLTPNGYKSFAGIRCLGNRSIYRVEFERGFWLECTSNHKLFVDALTRIPIDELIVGNTVLSKTGPIKILSIEDTSETQLVYDLVEVEDGHRYYTNGVLSSNCEFIIFEETLINPMFLTTMSGIDPIERQGQVRWFKRPSPGNMYVVALDPSLGTGGDPAAIQVIELPSMLQVAEWQHNRTPIQKQIGVLREINNHINECISSESDIYYSVENNTLGEAALVTIYELGEENIKGIFLSEPYRAGQARKYRKGFTTTNRTKISACAKLKSWIENRKLHIASSNLISELKTFVSQGTSFAAKPGETDDLVMSTLLAVRMMQVIQGFDADIDEKLRSTEEEWIEPLPFIVVS